MDFPTLFCLVFFFVKHLKMYISDSLDETTLQCGLALLCYSAVTLNEVISTYIVFEIKVKNPFGEGIF